MDALALVLVLGVVLWLAGISAKSNLAKQYPPPGQLVKVGEYSMHINCIGQGSPTVILDAGLGDFSVFWDLVQPQVAEFTRVCTYDRAGYGWSEPGPYPRKAETMAKELHTLLANAEVEEPYVLVGHSFGGALVRLYAHNYPGKVAGMVLVDAGPDDLFTRVPVWRKATKSMLGLYRALVPLRSFGILALTPGSTPNRGLPDNALARYRAILSTTRYLETAIAETESFEGNLVEVRAANITSLGDLPLIVLSRGIWDPLPFLSETENQQAWQAWQAMQSELVMLSSGSKQIIAEQSGHFVQLQQPELVVDAIREVVQATHK
jgi:pimeloyl-ACP methyl ester carboxylesterase